MTPESSYKAPEIELLRGIAAGQGVYPSDDDLTAVLGFLSTILPALADLEERLPPETPA